MYLAKRNIWWRKLIADPMAVVGLIILTVVVLLVLLAPFISPHNPTDIDLGYKLKPPGGGFPLGTDNPKSDIGK